MVKSKKIGRKTVKRSSTRKKTTEHVIPLGNGWVVKNSDADKFTVISDSKTEAVKIARQIAKQKGLDLVIHAKDGSIQEQISYQL
jgi:Uncharacterized protein conserved in bacteria (DUF2188)